MGKPRILVLGAAGVVGQHLMLNRPDWCDPLFYTRKEGFPELFDVVGPLDTEEQVVNLLEGLGIVGILNLAGEASPDAVERDQDKYWWVNRNLPIALATWCRDRDKWYFHASTQAVHEGTHSPYSVLLHPWEIPVNEYGRQKRWVEEHLQKWFKLHAIFRLTFILGVRPVSSLGRKNPAEAMLEDPGMPQTVDRWFSPLCAHAAARKIWSLMECTMLYQLYQVRWVLGNPISVTRHDLAGRLGGRGRGVSSSEFVGIAERPVDTTYAVGFNEPLEEGLERIKVEFMNRDEISRVQLAKEVALFLKRNEASTFQDLEKGFHFHHALVAEDFKRIGPTTEEGLLLWYTVTEAYIWELSAYHTEPGFNYVGMCQGIQDRLIAEGRSRVLCLGDGIGTLSLILAKAGLSPIYHDLSLSKTAQFAVFRHRAHQQRVEYRLSMDWSPVSLEDNLKDLDAVVALDFFEHLPNVERWVQMVWKVLRQGGVFLAQNAFGIGSGQEGSIPCHLAVNDKYQSEWAPLLERSGFQLEPASGWWRKV